MCDAEQIVRCAKTCRLPWIEFFKLKLCTSHDIFIYHLYKILTMSMTVHVCKAKRMHKFMDYGAKAICTCGMFIERKFLDTTNHTDIRAAPLPRMYEQKIFFIISPFKTNTRPVTNVCHCHVNFIDLCLTISRPVINQKRYDYFISHPRPSIFWIANAIARLKKIIFMTI